MFKAGQRIFLPGSGGEPTLLVKQILATDGADIVTSFVPGMNILDQSQFGAQTKLSGVFMHPSMGVAQRQGIYHHLPLSYYGMIKWIREGRKFDICVIQISPPDKEGYSSLGHIAEFTPEVMRRSDKICAVINPNVPRMKNSPRLALSNCARIYESDLPLVTYEGGTSDADTLLIAEQVARFIEDGSVIQMGLGKVPNAIMETLHDRRNIRLHSGMLSDGIMGMAEKGCLDSDWRHSTTAMLGSHGFYGWLDGRDDFHILGTEQTHDPAFLAGLENFVAINSALEVDLFGQCNLEIISGRAVSGVGGAVDFSHAARLGNRGLSIVALPATYAAGKKSRIGARLSQGALASLSRSAVDIIITEQGAADLRGKSVHERAEALISIAAPEFRRELTDHWRQVAAKL